MIGKQTTEELKRQIASRTHGQIGRLWGEMNGGGVHAVVAFLPRRCHLCYVGSRYGPYGVGTAGAAKIASTRRLLGDSESSRCGDNTWIKTRQASLRL